MNSTLKSFYLSVIGDTMNNKSDPIPINNDNNNEMSQDLSPIYSFSPIENINTVENNEINLLDTRTNIQTAQHDSLSNELEDFILTENYHDSSENDIIKNIVNRNDTNNNKMEEESHTEPDSDNESIQCGQRVETFGELETNMINLFVSNEDRISTDTSIDTFKGIINPEKENNETISSILQYNEIGMEQDENVNVDDNWNMNSFNRNELIQRNNDENAEDFTRYNTPTYLSENNNTQRIYTEDSTMQRKIELVAKEIIEKDKLERMDPNRTNTRTAETISNDTSIQEMRRLINRMGQTQNENSQRNVPGVSNKISNIHISPIPVSSSEVLEEDFIRAGQFRGNVPKKDSIDEIFTEDFSRHSEKENEEDRNEKKDEKPPVKSLKIIIKMPRKVNDPHKSLSNENVNITHKENNNSINEINSDELLKDILPESWKTAKKEEQLVVKDTVLSFKDIQENKIPVPSVISIPRKSNTQKRKNVTYTQKTLQFKETKPKNVSDTKKKQTNVKLTTTQVKVNRSRKKKVTTKVPFTIDEYFIVNKKKGKKFKESVHTRMKPLEFKEVLKITSQDNTLTSTRVQVEPKEPEHSKEEVNTQPLVINNSNGEAPLKRLNNQKKELKPLYYLTSVGLQKTAHIKRLNTQDANDIFKAVERRMVTTRKKTEKKRVENSFELKRILKNENNVIISITSEGIYFLPVGSGNLYYYDFNIKKLYSCDVCNIDVNRWVNVDDKHDTVSLSEDEKIIVSIIKKCSRMTHGHLGCLPNRNNIRNAVLMKFKDYPTSDIPGLFDDENIQTLLESNDIKKPKEITNEQYVNEPIFENGEIQQEDYDPNQQQYIQQEYPIASRIIPWSDILPSMNENNPEYYTNYEQEYIQPMDIQNDQQETVFNEQQNVNQNNEQNNNQNNNENNEQNEIYENNELTQLRFTQTQTRRASDLNS